VKKTVPFFAKGIICFLVLFLYASVIQAANPATIDVTVTIQNLSVSATGPIAFGTVVASSVTVSSDSSHVVNDGNVSETYSLKLTNPAGWAATSGSPGSETYRLSAQFNSSQPTSGSFGADHDLTTSDQTCSAAIFAGDQTGLSVPVSGSRYLWLKFEAPTSTTVTTEQTIVVTVTAAAG
jgi:hypothetical protein